MKRCPKCHRFGVQFDSQLGKEKCIWRNCLWVNHNNIDINKVEHPIIHWKFIEAISQKNKKEVESWPKWKQKYIISAEAFKTGKLKNE